MIETRDYTSGAQEDFLTVYRACLAHYGIAPATPDQETRVIGILNAGRHMSCLMAYESDAPLGFATWALTFPAGAGVALYMKELFVVRTARGKGVGRAILVGLLDRAEAEGCIRMDWQTDGDNPLSQSFYAGLEAPRFDKLNYRVSEAEFSRFRARLGGGV
ncbi:MAG: GNAT family N-acetyltransferase [Pseudomonadota bacterium]